jgi:hypothetical protein
MKNFIVGMLLVSSTAVFAQDFDHIAERERLTQEMESISSQLEKLYADLYDDEGNADAEVQAKIDALLKKIDGYSGRTQYLSSIGFEEVQEKYRQSDILRHFRRASNRYAAVTARDSKGQVIAHDTLNDLIYEVYDKNISEEYGCNGSSDDNTDENRSLPYEEGQAAYVDQVMQSLGYDNYRQLEDSNRSDFCEVSESVNNESAGTNLCNSFLSGMRLNLLEEVENKEIEKRKEITKIGYFNASNELFKELDAISLVKYEVEDQIKYTEGMCAEERLQNTLDVFNYLEDEIEKGGITIEFTNFSTTSGTGKARQN